VAGYPERQIRLPPVGFGEIHNGNLEIVLTESPSPLFQENSDLFQAPELLALVLESGDPGCRLAQRLCIRKPVSIRFRLTARGPPSSLHRHVDSLLRQPADRPPKTRANPGNNPFFQPSSLSSSLNSPDFPGLERPRTPVYYFNAEAELGRYRRSIPLAHVDCEFRLQPPGPPLGLRRRGVPEPRGRPGRQRLLSRALLCDGRSRFGASRCRSSTARYDVLALTFTGLGPSTAGA